MLGDKLVYLGRRWLQKEMWGIQATPRQACACGAIHVITNRGLSVTIKRCTQLLVEKSTQAFENESVHLLMYEVEERVTSMPLKGLLSIQFSREL